jgi:hypothetical protein
MSEILTEEIGDIIIEEKNQRETGRIKHQGDCESKARFPPMHKTAIFPTVRYAL